MTREAHPHETALRAARAALVRAALVRLARVRGPFRGHALRRLSQAVGRPARPAAPRALGPDTTLTTLMPSVSSRTARLGLGLAGGGGGSPGGLVGTGLTRG